MNLRDVTGECFECGDYISTVVGELKAAGVSREIVVRKIRPEKKPQRPGPRGREEREEAVLETRSGSMKAYNERGANHSFL